MDFDDHTRWLVAFIIFIVLPSSGIFHKQDIILVGVTWHMAAPRQHYDVHNITLANYFDRHIMCQKTAFVEICCYNMGWEEKGAINDGPSYSKPVQFGPPRGQLLLRLLLKLVSESNCLENRSRILVILLFINLAADL